MPARYNVLFLCTGNSARSIMAEAIIKRGFPETPPPTVRGATQPPRVHPQALRQLETAKLPTQGLRSKNWDEFAKPGAPELHFVFTVCDNAAKEVCPFWPGQPMTAHWVYRTPQLWLGLPNRSEKAFRDAFVTFGSQNKPAPFLAAG